MLALEKYIARRRRDGISPDAISGPAPSFAANGMRVRNGDARQIFRRHDASTSSAPAARDCIAI